MAGQAGGWLTRHQIRKNALEFAEKWKGKKHGKAGLLADSGGGKRGRKKDESAEAQTFYNEFFEVFGVKRPGTAFFEHYVKKIGRGRGFIDLYQMLKMFPSHTDGADPAARGPTAICCAHPQLSVQTRQRTRPESEHLAARAQIRRGARRRT